MSTGGVDLLLMKVSCCLSQVLEAHSRNRTATAMSPGSIAVPVGNFSPFSLHVLKIAVPVWSTAITANSGGKYGANTRALTWRKARWWAHPKPVLVLKSIHELDQPPCTTISTGVFVLLQNFIKRETHAHVRKISGSCGHNSSHCMGEAVRPESSRSPQAQAPSLRVQ